MIKKLHAISIYDYIDMLCEEIGCEWNDDLDMGQHLYNRQHNNKVNGKT